MNEPPGAAWYLHTALREIPRVLTLLDRDPSSPTYGCFDRNYWHYRTQDFPSGMYQELALPLAQVYALDLPGNRWRGEPRLRELALAGVRYAARSAHADGSCDDYFPYERALGATAFVAAAHAEVARLLEDRSPDTLAHLSRRAWWLVERTEHGRLANHQALVALAAARIGRLLADPALLEKARDRLALCLSWQHAEGWFTEYEGADPGYQSLTIAFLAALQPLVELPALDGMLDRALGFAAHFVYPDGAYGGEIGSRNTYQVLPSGFERLAHRFPQAVYLADQWLAGVVAGRRGYSDDDRIICHWLHDYVSAYLARRARRGYGAASWQPAAGVASFPAAGLHVIREHGLHLTVAGNKGGVFRAYRGQRLLRNDTGLVALLEKGTRLVSHMIDPQTEVELTEGTITIRGRMHAAQRHLSSPGKQIAFRLVNGTLGRVAPDLLRGLLQRVLITGKRPAALTYERTLDWRSPQVLKVRDRLVSFQEVSDPIAKLYAATDATSIYVATSNCWQEAA
ncbi:MAG: hypothetical protein ACREWG_00440, partial [Gammaproteobacteria bacterium]